ncbi:hypothetical protein LZL87_004991 [Fusarium oxysporum]|nr:hypothetical protein LZL87_004991 [Fusarium oxysporum]
MSQQPSPQQFPFLLSRVTRQIVYLNDTIGMYDGQEEHDNLVWDKNDEDFETAQQQLRLKTFCRKVEGFVQQKFGKPATLISPLIIGGFNILYRVQVEDMSPDVMFILDPPWWLLLETAEMWSPDLEEWRQTYESRLGIWLSAMEKAEASMGTPACNTLPVPLSRYMRESCQTGRFFLSYAAHERFFGDRDPGVVKGDLWRKRIDLLSDDMRAAMEPFVQRKLAESKDRLTVEWDETEAQKRLSFLLLAFNSGFTVDLIELHAREKW